MSKIRKSARGEMCQVRLEGVCVPIVENATTVLAHLPGGGMSGKSHDQAAAYACANCHDVLDGRVRLDPPHDPDFLNYELLKAVMATQEILREKGLM